MWYVVQVRSGLEEDMKLQCERIVSSDIMERCFVPYYEDMKRYEGSWHTERKVLFPGYLFVISDEPERLFMELKKVIGLTKLLEMDGEIIPLSREEVEFMTAFGKDEQIVGMSVGVIEEGIVKILDGPLKGHEAYIKKIDRHKRKAYLEMDMFGRKVKTEVGVEIVRKE